MKSYPDPQPANELRLNDAPGSDLELPVAPRFLSNPPQLDPQVMLRRIEENLAWRSTQPGEQQRRLAAKVTVEFVL